MTLDLRPGDRARIAIGNEFAIVTIVAFPEPGKVAIGVPEPCAGVVIVAIEQLEPPF